ncbi:Imm26 family immunity protein [Chitinivorax sp. B]|uniref:Imm26 family immunity protein n=1 Tax=Chitinivorax sp. B TaxID=2502235 RepID=UPI0014853A9F|nr:Imm26 family immunity protein [Chitinivorax sp. B]
MRKEKEGSLFRISLGEVDAFVRVLPNMQIAVYAISTPSNEEINLDEIYSASILFVITVMKAAFASEGWKKIDHRKLDADLSLPRNYFIRDRITGEYSIYCSSTGEISSSDYETCRSLEAAAVWEAKHVEDRIRDTLSGRPNMWAESLKAIP